MTDQNRLKGRLCAFFIACILSCVTVNALADTINIPSGTELLFATNFENTTFLESGVTKTEVTGTAGNFQGTDSTLPGYPTDWKTYADLMDVNRSINAIGPTVSDGSAAIIDDPTGSGRGKVLRFRSTQVATKTRVQVNSGIVGHNTFTSTMDVYIPSNIDTLSTYPSAVNWFTLAEFFIGNDFGTTYQNTCLTAPLYIQTVGCVPNYRVGLDLKKVNGQMVFALYGDFAGKIASDAEKARDGVTNAPTNGLTKADWFTAHSTQEPLYDQWVTLHLLYERYPNRSDGLGRMKLQMINSSNVATTLIDVRDVVVTDNFTASRRYAKIKTCPMKLYTANYFVQHIFANSNPDVMLMYYDKWRIFSGDATVTDGSQPTGSTTPKAPANFSVVQNGTNIDISWDAVTQYTDNSAIPGGVITGYDIRTASSNGTGATWTKFVDNQAGTSYSLTPPADGRYCYQAKTRATTNSSWVTEGCVDYVASPTPTSGSDPGLVDIYPFSTSGTVNTLSLTPPAPIAANRLAIACYVYRKDANNLTWGGSYGFTQIGQVVGTHGVANERDPDLRCFSKLTGASEPASYVLSLSGSPNNVEKIHAILAVFSNPDVTAIRDVQTVIANQSTSAVLPALSGGLSNSVALAVGAVWDNQEAPNTAAVPAGYTEEVNNTTLYSTARFAISLASVKAAADGTAAAATQTSAMPSNHVGMHILVSGLQIDTTPNAFTLADTSGHQSNSPLGALNTACASAISGLDQATEISVSGAQGVEYNIDGGTFTSDPGTIANGGVPCVRFNASDLYNSDETATLFIGGVFADYIVTTLAAPGVQLKFADNYDGSGMNRDSRIYNPDGSLRNTQIDVIAIYSSPPMYKESSQIAPVIGYALNKTPALGVLTLSESDLSGYTTASLVAGQIVWIDMWTNDNTFKMTRRLKVVVAE